MATFTFRGGGGGGGGGGGAGGFRFGPPGGAPGPSAAPAAVPAPAPKVLSAFDLSICDASNRAASIFAAFGKAAKFQAPAAVISAVAPPQVKFRQLDIGGTTTGQSNAGPTKVVPKKATANRTFAAWDAAFSFIELLNREAGQDGDESAPALAPPPLAYTMGYMLGVRCVQCGRCTTERTMIIGRHLGLTQCREMPMCPNCVRDSLLVSRMVIAQEAVSPHLLRGDAATQKFLQDADGFIITSPHMMFTLANSGALTTATTIRFECVAADTDLLEIAEHCKQLQHLVLAFGSAGNPYIFTECVNSLPSLKTLHVATGPTFHGAMSLIPEWSTNIEELGWILRNLNDNSDVSATDQECSLLLGALTSMLAETKVPPSLKRFIINANQNGSLGHFGRCETINHSQLVALAKSPMLTQLEELRIYAPFQYGEIAVSAFEHLSNLRVLRLRDWISQREYVSTMPPLTELQVPHAQLKEVACSSIGLPPGTTNDVLETLTLQINPRTLALVPTLTSLPQFTNVRQLTLRLALWITGTREFFAPLGGLHWLERAFIIGDCIYAVEALGHCSQLHTLSLDYMYSPDQTPGIPAPAPAPVPMPGAAPGPAAPAPVPPPLPARSFSSMDMMPVSKLSKLRTLACRNFIQPVLAPEVLRSLSLSHFACVGCSGFGDHHVQALVEANPYLDTLTLGDLPLLTNRGLLPLERLKWLRDMTILRCEHVTEAGLARAAERCQSLATVALEGGLSGSYVEDSNINVACANSGLHLRFPEFFSGLLLNNVRTSLC